MDSVKFIEEVDHLHSTHQFEATYKTMSKRIDAGLENETEENQMEILSRWARTLYYYGMFVASGKEKKAAYDLGLTVARKLSQNDKLGYGHLWYGVLLGTVSKSCGYKKQLEKCYEIGVHLKQAAEMLPNCFDAQHGYARFQYEISDLSGMVRTILKWAGGGHKLPSCSYAESLQLFLRAEALQPNFFSMNALYIGKCYNQLKQQENAIPYLQAAATWKIQFADDETAQKEARAMLKHFGVTEFQ